MNRFFIQLFLIYIAPSLVNAQLSGVVNIYAPVLTVTCNTISVQSSAGFFANDRVLIIQMQGAIIDTTQTSSFGNIISIGNAGNYEFATVSVVNGNDISLKRSLKRNYDVAGKVQLIKVPHYTDATVTGAVTCQPWNGSTGGVVAIEVDSSLTLNADINASGSGFRGGTISNNPDGGCGTGSSLYGYNVNQGGVAWNEGGAEKGEGIAIISTGINGGRGCKGNGGGGGNKHNTGGGGGSNYTAGGNGGIDMCNNPVGGIGGLSLSNFYFQNKTFMGGGGGCGDFNNAVGTTGTNGGGIIFISANNIYGNGYSIKANGNDNVAQTSGIGDGAGGGGAGGIILFAVNNFLSPLTAEAKGGKGGDLNTAIANCFGPGGGGGSGLVWLVSGTIPGNLSINTSAGVAGKELSPNSPCFNISNGATDGYNNATLNTLHNLKLQESTVNFNGIVNLGPDTTLCKGDTIILMGGLNGNSYLWQDGSTSITYTVTQPGQYTLTIVDNTYCSATDTVNISIANSFNLNLGTDTTICYGSTLLLDLTALNANYTWSTGSTAATIPITSNGTYTVTVNATGYCTEIDSIKVDTIPGFMLDIGPDTILCKNDLYILDAGIQNITYAWSTGETTQQITPTQTSIYYLEADNGNCKVTDTAFIEVRDLQVDLGIDTGICRGSQLIFSAPPLLTYLWQNGATTNSITLADSGTVWIAASDSVCTQTDTVTVTLNQIIDVYLPSAFTPNDDGVNDKFGALSTEILDFELVIVNRFGGIVFQTNNPAILWDGNTSSGPAPAGTYAYLVSFTSPCTDDKVTYRKLVTLLR